MNIELTKEEAAIVRSLLTLHKMAEGVHLKYERSCQCGFCEEMAALAKYQAAARDSLRHKVGWRG